MSFGNAWELFRQTMAEWSEDNVPQLGAALAFYTALSIAPLLVITLAIVTFFYGDDAARSQVAERLTSLVGVEGGKAIEEMIASANKPTTGLIATTLSIITLLFGASGVFGQLQSALNTIWEVRPKPGRGLWGFLRDRFLSFTMVMGMALLLLVSLVVTAAIASAIALFSGTGESLLWVAQAVNFATSFAMVTMLFGLMFKLLPDVKMAWSDVWLGAVITALLFVIGNFLIGLYLGHSNMASSYGVAGSFVVLLAWVYYSAQIFFFGAELTQVYANRFGSGIVPAANAEAVNSVDQVKQA